MSGATGLAAISVQAAAPMPVAAGGGAAAPPAAAPAAAQPDLPAASGNKAPKTGQVASPVSATLLSLSTGGQVKDATAVDAAKPAGGPAAGYAEFGAAEAEAAPESSATASYSVEAAASQDGTGGPGGQNAPYGRPPASVPLHIIPAWHILPPARTF